MIQDFFHQISNEMIKLKTISVNIHTAVAFKSNSLAIKSKQTKIKTAKFKCRTGPSCFGRVAYTCSKFKPCD